MNTLVVGAFLALGLALSGSFMLETIAGYGGKSAELLADQNR